jgi:hypothetical protein
MRQNGDVKQVSCRGSHILGVSVQNLVHLCSSAPSMFYFPSLGLPFGLQWEVLSDNKSFKLECYFGFNFCYILLIIWTWKCEGVAQGRAPQNARFIPTFFVKAIKSRSLRRAQYVGSVGEKRNTHKIFILRLLSCKNLLGYCVADGRIMLK